MTTEGRRYKTPAEIKMFQKLNSDFVGMTSAPEAISSRKLKICYANLCFVSAMAAGVKARIRIYKMVEITKQISYRLEQALIYAMQALPLERKNCPGYKALEEARFN
jgi:5'-methylthioadenosine phosphorylase